MNPLVSVIVPCYRQAHFLDECIGTLNRQTCTSWEAIIVNDGSPDDTGAVAARLAAADSRVRCINKLNGGLSSARNAGLDAARGQWIQFLDADDLLEPEKFAVDLAATTNLQRPGVVIDDYCFMDELGHRFANQHCRPRFLSDRHALELAIRWETDLSIPVHSFLLDARLFREHALRFDETLRNHEDWDMWMKVFAFGPSVVLTGHQAAIYRVTSGSMARDQDAMLQGFRSAIRRQLAVDGLDREMAAALSAKLPLTDHHYRKGWRPWLAAMMDQRLIARTFPWPLQRSIRRLALLELSVHVDNVNRRFLSASHSGVDGAQAS